MIEFILTAVISFSIGALSISILWRREVKQSDKDYKDLAAQNQTLLKKLAKASKNDKRNPKTGRYTK